MGTLEVDKSLKAAFKETLEPHGFKKVKGRYPHFVRMATPEIIQVINYRLEQSFFSFATQIENGILVTVT